MLHSYIADTEILNIRDLKQRRRRRWRERQKTIVNNYSPKWRSVNSGGYLPSREAAR